MRFVRLSKLLIPVAAAALLLAACAPAATVTPPPIPTLTAAPAPTATPEPITLTDSLGHPVTLAAPAQKIVSLAPSNTEILFALEVGDRLIGRDEPSDYPAAALDVPSIGSLYPSVNAEAVVALAPDLVLAAGITNPDDVQRLIDLGLTVYATSVSSGLEDIYGDIEAIGRLTGESEAAAGLVAGLRTRVDAVSTSAGQAADRPLVYYELDATEPARPWTPGPGSFIDQLVTLAGGQNAGNVGADLYYQISLEQLVALDPAVIVLGSFTYGGETPETVAARPGWGDMSAVKNGTVYTFDDNLVSRPGPRVVDGLEQLAKLIHPELYQ